MSRKMGTNNNFILIIKCAKEAKLSAAFKSWVSILGSNELNKRSIIEWHLLTQ